MGWVHREKIFVKRENVSERGLPHVKTGRSVLRKRRKLEKLKKQHMPEQ